MNMPNTMKMKATSRLRRSKRPALRPPARRRAAAAGAGARRVAHGLRGLACRAPRRRTRARRAGSACGSALVAGVDGGDDRQAGPQRHAPSARPPAKAMRTATRCTTLVKLPVALSGGSSENCEPEAGATEVTTPSIDRPPSASTATSTFWPGLDRGELRLLEIGVDIGRCRAAPAPSGACPAGRYCRPAPPCCRRRRRTARRSR